MSGHNSRIRLLAPGLLTAANMVVGYLAILATAEQRYTLSVYLLLLAILLDMFDGRVARWLNATTKFGQEMDSFSDSLSFCAAPAFLAQQAILRPLGPIGVAVSTLYLLAGVWRLVRFNLTSQVHSKASHTLGVPTPIAASYVMALVLMRDHVSPTVAGIVISVMALLMISRLRLPELTGRGLVPYALIVGIVNYFAVVSWPNWYTIGWWNLWNAVILLVARAEHRSLQEAQSST
jgi:CDP-diacylglycerol--serine O-phosphatidyltransferase